MKEFLQRTKLMTVLVSIVLIILGILLLVNPTGALLTVCRIAGCILLLSGAVLIAVFLSRKGCESGSVWDVALCVLGVVMLALGLFVIIRPAAVLSFMGLLFAIILFLHGFYDLREMRMLKRMNAGRWRISLICTGVTFLMGILMLFLPVAVGSLATALAGVFLIYNGVADLYIAFRVMRASRRWGGYTGGKVIDGHAEEIDE